MDLDKIRQTLEESRTHIETMWIKGMWFGDKRKQDVTEDGPAKTDIQYTCLAGSVLYALDYTDLRYTDEQEVREIIQRLYTKIPHQSYEKRLAQTRLRKHMVTDHPASHRLIMEHTEPAAQKIRIEAYFYDDGSCRECYRIQRDGLTRWNDAVRRTKKDVLKVMDATIKDTIKEMEKV